MSEVPKELSNKDIQANNGVQRAPLVLLPEQYKKRLGGQEYMPQPDLHFFNKLTEKYGFLSSRPPEGQQRAEFTRENFFSAVSAIKEYAFQLREEDWHPEQTPFDNSVDINSRPGKIALNEYAKREKARPSTKRIGDLVYLFLHTPTVKGVYSQIHAEKMAAALPEFANDLRGPFPTNNLSEYLSYATTVMQESMMFVVDERNDERDTDLGILTGYEEYDYLRPASLHKRDFAIQGTHLFGVVLEKTIREALENHEDISARVRKEFLDRKGLAQQLMRISLRDFGNRALPDITNQTIDQARSTIEREEYYTGACPAILKIPSVAGEVERPIAYEYAAVITNNRPEDLAA